MKFGLKMGWITVINQETVLVQIHRHQKLQDTLLQKQWLPYEPSYHNSLCLQKLEGVMDGCLVWILDKLGSTLPV